MIKKILALMLLGALSLPTQKLEASKTAAAGFGVASFGLLGAALETEMRRLSPQKRDALELETSARFSKNPLRALKQVAHNRARFLKYVSHTIKTKGMGKALKTFPYLFGGASLAMLSAGAATYKAVQSTGPDQAELDRQAEQARIRLEDEQRLETERLAATALREERERAATDRLTATERRRLADEACEAADHAAYDAEQQRLAEQARIQREEQERLERERLAAQVEIPSSSLASVLPVLNTAGTSGSSSGSSSSSSSSSARALPQAPNSLGINFSEPITADSPAAFTAEVRARRDLIQNKSTEATPDAAQLNDACTVASTELDKHPVYTRFNVDHEAARHTAWIAACEAAHTNPSHTVSRHMLTKENPLAATAIDAVYVFAQQQANQTLTPNEFYQGAIQHARQAASILRGRIQHRAARITIAEETAMSAVQSYIETMPRQRCNAQAEAFLLASRVENIYAATFSTMMDPENSRALFGTRSTPASQALVIDAAMDAGARAIHDHSGSALQSLNVTLQSLHIPPPPPIIPSGIQPASGPDTRINMLAAIQQGAFVLRRTVAENTPSSRTSDLGTAIGGARAGLRPVVHQAPEHVRQRTMFDDMVDRVQVGASIEASIMAGSQSILAQSILASQSIAPTLLAASHPEILQPADIVRRAAQQELMPALIPIFLRPLLIEIRTSASQLPELSDRKYSGHSMNDEVKNVIRGIVVLSLREAYNEYSSEDYIRAKVMAIVQRVLNDQGVKDAMEGYDPIAVDQSTTVDPIKNAIAGAYAQIHSMTDEAIGLQALHEYALTDFSTRAQASGSSASSEEGRAAVQRGHLELLQKMSDIQRALHQGGDDSDDDDDWD